MSSNTTGNNSTSDTNAVHHLVRMALHMRKNNQTQDPRYGKVLALLKQHHLKTPLLVKETMERLSAEHLESSAVPMNSSAVSTVAAVSHPYFDSQNTQLFSEKQLGSLRRQIELYKALSTSMTRLLQAQSVKHSNQELLKEKRQRQRQQAVLKSEIPRRQDHSSKSIPTMARPAAAAADVRAAAAPPVVVRKPEWRRRDQNLVYLGPSKYDGNLIMSISKDMPSVALDLQALYDERERRCAAKSTSDEWLTDQLRRIQHDLRRQLWEAYEANLIAHGEPLLVDRSSFRRRRPQSREEIRDSERDQRKQHVQREHKRRQNHQVYLRAVINHSRDFFAFHKNLQANVAKAAKGAKSIVDQKVQRAEREEDKQEKLRLKALKANDMEAYSKLVAEAKNERLTYLLQQTDHYLSDIRSLVQKHRGMHRLGGHPDELDYLNVVERGELPRQPQMLVGGDLKEYQLRGLQWMASLYDNRLNGILADEMGLGKTIQSIALIAHVMEVKHNNGPFLVVVPLSTLSNWVNEFQKWAPDATLVVYKGAPQARKDIFRDEMASGQFNVLLTTYEYIMKDKHVLRKYEWQYIIVDEGHRMKNAQSKFAQTLGTMYISRNRLLLTGTPLQNSLPELWALLNFLLPTIFNSVDTFEQWFSKPFSQFSGTGETNELSDEERMLIINRLHQVLRPFLLRRVKASVMDQLPQKVERILKCDLSGWQKIMYRRIQEGGALLVDPANGTIKSGSSVSRGLSNIIMQLRKVCNHPYLFQIDAGYPIDFTVVRSSGKFELLDRMLPKLKAGGHRVLMFSQMTQLMTVLEDYFTWRGFTYLRLDGSTSADEREQRMYMFNASDSPYFIFLLSTRAGGLGLNLATADTVVLFDSDWNPAMDAQAQDRAHRIGQKNEVRVFRLVTNSPIEEKILSRATDKLNMNNLIVEAGKFNNRSKEAERKAMLESLIKLESEDTTEENEGALNDDQINEMMALTDEELVLYRKIDEDRRVQELADWEHMKQIDPKLSGPIPSRLMQEKDAPEWLQKADREIEEQQQNQLMGSIPFDMGPRKRKDISYRPLTDTEFGQLIDGGEQDGGMSSVAVSSLPYPSVSSVAVSSVAAVAVADSTVASEPVKKKKKKRRIKMVMSEEEDTPTRTTEHNQRKRRRKSLPVVTNPARAALLCPYYRTVYDAVLSATDDTGRTRSDLYVHKPSKVQYPDYYQLIKDPIDLNTIRKRIDRNQYDAHEQFISDMKKLFGNAQTYNHPESWVYQDSVEMDKIFDAAMAKVTSMDFDGPMLRPSTAL